MRLQNRKSKLSGDSTVVWQFLIIIAVLNFLEIIPTLVQIKGPQAALIALGYAVIPVVVILFFVRLIDRWEPEPPAMYYLAFFWGAGTSVIAASKINGITSDLLLPWNCDAACSDWLLSAYGAPIAEEVIKGLGILLICFAFNKYFDGPIDGIVYGALIGSGFAFTENILYFLNDYDAIFVVFQIRFLDGPLNHEAWSAVFGFFLGFAANKRSRWAVIPWLIPAFAFATLGHWFNNDALRWSGMTYERYVFLNNVPLCIVLLAIVVYARYRERSVVCEALTEYAHAGWFPLKDVRMVCSINLRKGAAEWAAERFMLHGAAPEDGTKLMQNYQETLLSLGLLRARAKKRKMVQSAVHRAAERDLLDELSALRTVLSQI